MRLLKRDDDGKLSLAKDLSDDIPSYAILSHTWGAESEEVTYADLLDGTGESKIGYGKLRFCGEQAKLDGLQYFWVDTCCIKKSSSTELSEALNSMFKWYRNAARCYVYLSDVSTDDSTQPDSLSQPWQSAFHNSRWFTRGWTLQELLAPSSVEFFCANGKRLGDKKSLEKSLREITRIEVLALRGTPLSKFTITERMSWMSKRVTKREEDMAYSLLGIFDVFMPPIYGEGKENALSRLRECLHKREKRQRLDDISIVTSNVPKRSKHLVTVSSSGASGVDLNSPEPESRPFFPSWQGMNATTKTSLVDRLYFPQIDERLTGLTPAHGKSCRWFLAKQEYLSWHNLAHYPDHGGFLWIKGNPGTGKSTLMKLLFDEAKLKSKDNPLQITLSFFFLARGTIEERSTMGLYRSLLHQLFTKGPELSDSLEWITYDGARGILQTGWHKEALKQTLVQVIRNLRTRVLTIFIDALDECDKDQISDMVSFFEELCDHARESKVWLQICFSSRYYPTVVIQKGIEVALEDETGHTEDIKYYVKLKLRVGKMKKVETLRSQIHEKCSGIFLWVVLVVDILNSEYRNGSTATKIFESLQKIPPGLIELFEMIITRDGENLEQLQICLQWILFASRPLKPQELYFAIQIGLKEKHSGFWDQDDIDLEQIKSFVRSSSKGLAEVTGKKVCKVQFIHESVREFLLDRYESQWSVHSGNFKGQSHESLRVCCLVQLNTLAKQDIDLQEPTGMPQSPETKNLREKFPFLEYSVINLLHHANTAQQNSVEQEEFLAKFPLAKWIAVNNALEKFRVRQYSKSASLLYLLAERNLDSLIRIHPQRKFCFDTGEERYGPPMFAALAMGCNEVVRAFLQIQLADKPISSLLHHVWEQYCQIGLERVSFGRDFTFSQQRRSIESYLAEHGNDIVLAFYLDTGVDVNSKDKDGRTALSWAARSNHLYAVQLLLGMKGVDVDSKDNQGRTPLSWAAQSGNIQVVELLLSTEGVKADSKDNGDQTPLSWAANHGHVAIVKILLATDRVDVNSKGVIGLSPLSYAARRGHSAVVELLLATEGVDADSRSNRGHTPLMRAAEYGHFRVIQLLLATKRVYAETKDNRGRTPLALAAQNGYDDIVKLLRSAIDL